MARILSRCKGGACNPGLKKIVKQTASGHRQGYWVKRGTKEASGLLKRLIKNYHDSGRQMERDAHHVTKRMPHAVRKTAVGLTRRVLKHAAAPARVGTALFKATRKS